MSGDTMGETSDYPAKLGIFVMIYPLVIMGIYRDL